MTREKRSITLHGHRTSVALEPEFWEILDQIAKQSERSLAGLIAEIDDQRVEARSARGLASYLRVWVLQAVTSDSGN